MDQLLRLIEDRHSAREPFDSQHQLLPQDLQRILEAARWAPTAHNMQNFEIVIVDEPALLDSLGAIRSKVSETFLRENYEQLSFSEAELRQKGTGLLSASFPVAWTDPDQLAQVAQESAPVTLSQTLQGAPTLLIALYDTRKRAPASEGDVLGLMSLGCMMENLWLMAQSLGVGMQIMSVFSEEPVAGAVARALAIPAHMKIAFAARLGYPIAPSSDYLRVRRAASAFTHYNRF